MSIPEKDDPTKIGIGDESAWPLLSDLDLAIWACLANARLDQERASQQHQQFVAA